MSLTETMQAYYAAYNEEDENKLAALLCDDVILESAAGIQAGKDAYISTYRYMIGTFDDKMTPEAIETEGDKVTVRITDTLKARSDVEFMGQQLSAGEQLVLRLVGRYAFKGGKIAHIAIEPADG